MTIRNIGRRMIPSLACVVVLLCDQIPLYGQTAALVSREQAIAQLQKHLDTISTRMKAVEPRFSEDNCLKTISDAMDQGGLSVASRDGQLGGLRSTCGYLTGHWQEFFTGNQRRLEVALAFFRGQESESSMTEVAQAAGWAVQKTYLDDLDREMTAFKQREQEVADLFSRWVEAEALKNFEWDRAGTRVSKVRALKANEIYNTLMERVYEQVVHANLSGDTFGPARHRPSAAPVSPPNFKTAYGAATSALP